MFSVQKKLISILLFLLPIGIILFALANPASANTNVNKDLIIKLKNHADPFKITFTQSTNLEEVIQYYNKHDSVEYAEPNQTYNIALEPLDTFFTQQAYLTQIQANRAWNEIRESPEVIIAIIDTGVDIGNPDLITNIWQNKKEFPGNGIDDDGNGFIDDIHGWDFVTDTPDVKPKFDEGYTKVAMNHGTIVAGVVAAQGGNSEGIAGITWRAKIMPLRVLDGTGMGDTLAVAKAIKYARENGANIINLSFIGEGQSDTLSLAIQNAYRAGIMIVAAAGNEVAQGEDMDIKPYYPVCQDGKEGENWVIGVAAVNNYDRKGSFSNYGHNCIDVSAPGLGIFSSQFYAPEYEDFTHRYGGYWTGTSVAAPQVAGLAALVKALNPDISLTEWQRLIIDNTDNIDFENRNTPWAGKLGSGRINVFKTITVAKTFSPRQVEEIENFIVTGAGVGGGPHVRLFDLSGNVKLQFFAYESEFNGGVNASVGDLNNDGFMEIITSPASQRLPEIKIFDRWGSQINSFLAFDKSYTGGFNAIPGDIDGDKIQEIIAAPNKGGLPLIRIFDQNGEIISEFFAYNRLFTGGVQIAVADVDFDGKDEIITVPGPGASPILKIFDAEGNVKEQFMVGEPDEIFGFSVGAWRNTIVVGKGTGAKPLVQIYDLNGNKLQEWLAYDENFHGGIRVQVGDPNEDNQIDIISGPAQGGGPHLKIFNYEGTVLKQWMAYNPAFHGGISIRLTTINN